MLGLFKKKPAVVNQPKDPSLIVPRIKHTNFLVYARDNTKNEDDLPPTEPLVADLIITYAFDLPEMFTMARMRDIRELGLSSEQLRAIAVTNLKQQLRNIGRQGDPPVMRMVTGNGLEACVLLLDDFWQSLSGKIPPEIIVGVPTRDVLFVSSTRAGKEGIRQLREAVRQARTGDNTHWLTEHLLVRRADKWEVFDENI